MFDGKKGPNGRLFWKRNLDTDGGRAPAFIRSAIGTIFAYLAFNQKNHRMLIKIDPIKIRKLDRYCDVGGKLLNIWDSDEKCNKLSDIRLTFRTGEGKHYSKLICLDCYYRYLERGFSKMTKYFNLDGRVAMLPYADKTVAFKFGKKAEGGKTR